MLIVGPFGALAVAALVQFEAIDYGQASLDALQRAIAPHANGAHHDALLALRSMHDERLAPLFKVLADSSDPTSAIDGVLGEAELATPKTVTALSLRLISDPIARAAAIRAAVGLDLLSQDTARELLTWEDLDPVDRAVLSSVLVEHGDPIDTASLQPLLADQRAAVAGLAGALLAQSGASDGWEQFVTRVRALPDADRTEAVQELARAAEAYSLRAVAPHLVDLASDPTLALAPRLLVMGTVLKLNPSLAEPLWRAATQDRSQVALLRAGLQLLVSSETPTAGWATPLRNGDPSMDAIANAIDAAASADHAGLPEALAAMVRTRQRLLCEAALQRSRSIDDGAVKPVLEAIVDAGTTPDATLPFRSMALDAGQRLAKIDPEAMVTRLRTNATDRDASELIVTAIYSSNNPVAASGAVAMRNVLGRTAACMACMASARASQTPDPAVLREVGVAASGGGDLSINFRTQAAWIFLAKSGQADRAIQSLRESALPKSP